MSEPKNYKDTINLPSSPFPMKANLPQREPELIKKWQETKTYEAMLENSNEGSFCMPDGPPYANGNIHLGHVLNKVLKDIIIKYKNLSGQKSAFIPGWDCHGLPIELKVTKALGKKKNDLSDKQIRELCRQEANRWVNTQREQFKRLGILADWEQPYLTLQPEYEAEEVRVLADILDNGILVRGEKPVYWCPALQTALAAAEIEYQDHKSPSVYVKFYITEQLEKLGSPGKPTAFVIWTTTPWTLPANLAIAVHPDFDYGLYETEDENIIIAVDLKENLEQTAKITLKKLNTFKGRDLEGLNAQHPFIPRESKLILGEHVTLEAGTGCVHTAPGHGLEDYQVGLKYGLGTYCPVDPAGRYTSDFPEMEGTKIWDANKLIVEKLVNSKHMLAHSEIIHSYPHNPRSNTPLIFRATPQWFIRVDDENYNLRQKALTAVENEINFIPTWGSQRLNAMVSNAPDWCLSRQRMWGVPIPVFYCNDCGEALIKSSIMRAVADKMEQSQQGIEAYFDSDGKEFVGNHKCEKCNSQNFTPGKDILDVWFDSGVCHTAVQKKRKELSFPADIYIEGSDQHRGWFQTSLMSSLAASGESPFKTLVTHGFVNDSKGHKMSKSKGNIIDPADVIKKSGAEILRLWVAYEDYGQDVNISNEMFQRISETYRRIRNTMKFLLGNINDFDPNQHRIDFANMPPLDQWALIKLNDLIKTTTMAYEEFNFYKVYHALNNFFTVDLSSIYLDILKDRLYTGKKDGVPRRASQTVILELLNTLTTIMAPILSFLAEEVYTYIPETQKDSIFSTTFPKINPEWHNDQVKEDFELLLALRSEVSHALEPLRKDKTIGSNLDAKISITATKHHYSIFKKYETMLCEFLIVSQIELQAGDENKIIGQKADGEKCVRCWYYSTKLNSHSEHPDICPKCIEALS